MTLPTGGPARTLAVALAAIGPPSRVAAVEARERQERMTKPPGSLGVLEDVSVQLAGLAGHCPPPLPEPAAVAVFAADHGVYAQGVTPWPQEVTAQMVANFLAGGAVVNAFAAQVGAEVVVVDVGLRSDLGGSPGVRPAAPGLLSRRVRDGTADLAVGPAMTRAEAVAALEVGIDVAADLVAAGSRVLLTGDMGIANTTVSAALIAALTGLDPVEVTGRGTGVDDETYARKVAVVRRALARHGLDRPPPTRPDAARRDAAQPRPVPDPVDVLAAVGGLEHAALAGFVLGAAASRVPVVLDGVSAAAATLVAAGLAPHCLAACIAGHRSAEPGSAAALRHLGLTPLIDLGLRLGEGTGALLALPLVQGAVRALRDVATFDAAGVARKE